MNTNKINSIYLTRHVMEGGGELSLTVPSMQVKWAIDNWSGADSALLVGVHIHLICFLPHIVLFLGGTRYTHDVGIGIIPKKNDRSQYSS